MKVVDICTRQTLRTERSWEKLSFEMIPDASGK